MNTLKPLVAMQLKDKIDFSKYNYQKGKFNKKLLFSILFSLLKFVVITAVIYVGFYLLSFLRLVDLVQGIPDKLLLVVFTLMFGLSIIVATLSLMKALYFSKDNTLLLTFPTSKLNMFLSKMIVFFIYELLRNVYFILPIFVAFGLINGYSILYFFVIIFATIIYTLLVISISGLLSIPAMLVNMLLKNNRILEVCVTGLFLGFCIYLIVTFINLIPANFDLVKTWGTTFWQIQDFLSAFQSAVIPIYWVMVAFVGTRYGIQHTMFSGTQLLCLLGVIGTISVVMGLCFLLVRPLFFKMASMPFEYKKSTKIAKKQNNKKASFLSAVYKEFLIFLRTPDKLEPLFYIAVGLPLSILLLNKIFNAMDTRLTGTYMTIAFNVLIMLLVVLSSNGVMAKVYSEEGLSAYLLKTNPQNYYKSLLSKLVINAVVMTISIGVTVGIYSSFVNPYYVNSVLLFLSLLFVYLAHLLWSAELDLMNPQNNQYATTGTHYNNPNETKSTFIAFGLSAGIAFVTYFLINENSRIFWWKLCIGALIFFAVRTYFYLEKIRLYYKEK